MRRVKLILLKARDAANCFVVVLQSCHHTSCARFGQQRPAACLPCMDSQQKLVQAPNVDSRTWAPAVLTGGAALVTDLTFCIGISQSRCAIFRQGTPLHATNTRVPAAGMMRRVILILLKARDAANCFFVVLQSCHHTSRARFGQQRPAACCFLPRIHSKS